MKNYLKHKFGFKLNVKAPKFWYKKNDTYLSNTLYPLSLLFRFGTKLRNFVSRTSSLEAFL